MRKTETRFCLDPWVITASIPPPPPQPLSIPPPPPVKTKLALFMTNGETEDFADHRQFKTFEKEKKKLKPLVDTKATAVSATFAICFDTFTNWIFNLFPKKSNNDWVYYEYPDMEGFAAEYRAVSNQCDMRPASYQVGDLKTTSDSVPFSFVRYTRKDVWEMFKQHFWDGDWDAIISIASSEQWRGAYYEPESQCIYVERVLLFDAMQPKISSNLTDLPTMTSKLARLSASATYVNSDGTKHSLQNAERAAVLNFATYKNADLMGQVFQPLPMSKQ